MMEESQSDIYSILISYLFATLNLQGHDTLECELNGISLISKRAVAIPTLF